MGILEILFWTVLINWAFPFTVSMIYVLWAWLIMRDISYEGWVLWRGIFPALRFRLLPVHTWYTRLWDRFYGQALFMVMIHKDQLGPSDDRWVENTIVHEMRHVMQQWVLGLAQWVLYGLHSAYLAVFTNKNPYRDNWFERDARAAVGRWVMRGRPRTFNFGRRH